VAKPFKLRLLTPYKSVFEDEVEAISMPGENGEFGVLAGHTKFITTLVPGVLRYVHDGKTERAAIGGGFAEVSPAGVTVLADSMEKPEEIDVERAELSRREALEDLKKKSELSTEQVTHIEERLSRARNRLRIAKPEGHSS